MDIYKLFVVVLIAAAVWTVLHVIMAVVFLLTGQLVRSDRPLVIYFGTCALVIAGIIVCAAFAVMKLGEFWLC